MGDASLIVAIFGVITAALLLTIIGSLKEIVVELRRINERLEGLESKAGS